MSGISPRPAGIKPQTAFAVGLLALLIIAPLALAPTFPTSSDVTARPQPAAVAASTRMPELVRERQISYETVADGTSFVRDADSRQSLVVVAPGDGGFVTTAMRLLVRERTRTGRPANEPFVLAQWTTGSLTITDPQTDRSIELNAFGRTNAGAFAALLYKEDTR